MNFDRIAPIYRWLELAAFDGTLQRARTAFAREAIGRKRGLIIGDGDGRFLAEIVRLNQAIRIDYVESSGVMIRRARQRLSESVNVQFHEADIQKWCLPPAAAMELPPPRRYDFVATHFFLDCFSRAAIAGIVRQVAMLTLPGTIWLIADFNLPLTGWQRMHARLWLAAMYGFFRATTALEGSRLIDPTQDFVANGFGLRAEKRWRFDLIRSQLWQRF